MDAEVKAQQVGAVLVLAGDVNVELSGWDLSGQSDGVLKLVFASRQRALEVGVVGSCLLANIESAGQQSDEAEFDHDISKGSVL